MYREKIEARREKLTAEIEKLKKEIAHLPEGKLLSVQNGKYRKWFQANGHYPIYIPKKKVHLARQLAYKGFLEKQVELLEREQQGNARYLELCPLSYEEEMAAFMEMPINKELLQLAFSPREEELRLWMQEEYQGNPKYSEKLIYQTASGIYVRSKSEAMIAMLLHMNQIPFRYEAPLTILGMTFYPDFTIRHPRTGEYFYWEHLGMYGDEGYRKQVYRKMEAYAQQDIIPMRNLILTFETEDKPLDMEQVNEYIEQYFL